MEIPLYYFVNIIILSKSAFEMRKGVNEKRCKTIEDLEKEYNIDYNN